MKKEYYKKNTPKYKLMTDLDINNCASVNEFTGMIPTPPQSEEERENYMDIMDYSPESVDIFKKKENEM